MLIKTLETLKADSVVWSYSSLEITVVASSYYPNRGGRYPYFSILTKSTAIILSREKDVSAWSVMLVNTF